MSTTTGTNAAVSLGVFSLGSDGGFFQSNFGTNNGIRLRSTATGIGQLQAWSGAAWVNTLQVTGSTQAVTIPGALSSGPETIAGGTLTDQATALTLTATQPAVIANTQSAVKMLVTSAGSSAFNNVGLNVQYLAGYTGSNATYAISGSNIALGTGTTLIPASGSNASLTNAGVIGGSAQNTVGYNAGLVGYGTDGAVNSGVLGLSQVAKNSGTNIGGTFSAVNTGSSPVQIGVFASLNQISVPAVSAALIADNGAQTSPILLLRDNASTVFTVADGGAVTSTSTIQGTQLTSTIATGTAPLVVASTTQVANLNAATLGFTAFSGPTTSTKTFTLPNASATVLTDNATVTVAQGGTGRVTGTTAYALIAVGTTATGAQQSLAAGATTEILVGGGASALPVWTTAQGSGAPVRATSPTLTTPVLGVATATSVTASTVITSGVSVVTDGAGAVINASLGNTFTWTAAADRTAGTTTNAVAGQRMIICFTASGGARTLTLPVATTGDFAFGSDITTIPQTPSGKTTVVGCIYNSVVANRWAVVAVVNGY